MTRHRVMWLAKKSVGRTGKSKGREGKREEEGVVASLRMGRSRHILSINVAQKIDSL